MKKETRILLRRAIFYSGPILVVAIGSFLFKPGNYFKPPSCESAYYQCMRDIEETRRDDIADCTNKSVKENTLCKSRINVDLIPKEDRCRADRAECLKDSYQRLGQ